MGLYFLNTILNILGPVREVAGFSQTRKPQRVHLIPGKDNFDEPFTLEAENLVAGTFRFESGVFGSLMLNSCSIPNELPRIVLYGDQGILSIPNPNFFSGNVEVILKGQAEKLVLPPTHGFSDNCRGVGVAELAWSLRRGRKPRSSKEMAFHGLELLFGLFKSDETKGFYRMTSSFTRPEPLPRGHLLTPETSLAL
jgi:predicted dehydrogenase